MIATTIRQIVSDVLKQNNLNNTFKVKSTNFSCERFKSCYFNVTIQNWENNPIADIVKKQIKEKENELKIGILVTFTGKNIIQA